VNKRIDSKLIKFMYFFIALFLILYMGYHIIVFFRSPVTTVRPVLQSVEDSLTIDGYFVRNEIVIEREPGIVDLCVDEGTRVAKGQALAALYDTQAQIDTNRRIELLQARKKMLEDIRARSVTVNDAMIYGQLAVISGACDAGATQSLRMDSQELRRLLFLREHFYEDDETLNGMLAAINEDLRKITAAQASGMIYSPQTAYFSSYTDGYEGVLTPDIFKEVTVAAMKTWPEKREKIDDGSVLGKLAPDFDWYFIAEFPYKDRNRLLNNNRYSKLTVRFGQETVTMQAVSVGGDENGKCAVVFTSRDNMAGTIRMRRQTADIIFRTDNGLRIPKKALRTNDKGENGVYCLAAGAAIWKKVDVIPVESDTYYLVAYDKTNPKALRDTDEVIIGTGLYNGKKVR